MYVVDEKLTTRKFRLHSHNLHKQRLTEIKNKASTRINNSVPRTLKFQQIKLSGFITQVKERKTNIQKENMKIYQIISKISSGKRGSSIQMILDSVKGQSQPKSLNLTSRKKEAQRIIDDNEALARRLNETNHGVSFSKFDEEWLNVTKYMKSISKKHIRKLPKLENSSNYLHSLGSELSNKKPETSRSPLSNFQIRNLSVFSPALNSPQMSKLEDFQKPESIDLVGKKEEDKPIESLEKEKKVLRYDLAKNIIKENKEVDKGKIVEMENSKESLNKNSEKSTSLKQKIDGVDDEKYSDEEFDEDKTSNKILEKDYSEENDEYSDKIEKNSEKSEKNSEKSEKNSEILENESKTIKNTTHIPEFKIKEVNIPENKPDPRENNSLIHNNEDNTAKSLENESKLE